MMYSSRHAYRYSSAVMFPCAIQDPSQRPDLEGHVYCNTSVFYTYVYTRVHVYYTCYVLGRVCARGMYGFPCRACPRLQYSKPYCLSTTPSSMVERVLAHVHSTWSTYSSKYSPLYCTPCTRVLVPVGVLFVQRVRQDGGSFCSWPVGKNKPMFFHFGEG